MLILSDTAGVCDRGAMFVAGSMQRFTPPDQDQLLHIQRGHLCRPCQHPAAVLAERLRLEQFFLGLTELLLGCCCRVWIVVGVLTVRVTDAAAAAADAAAAAAAVAWCRIDVL